MGTTATRPVSAKGGHAGRNAAIIIVVLLFIFFFLPIVPYNYTVKSNLGLTTTHVTGDVSPSAYLFGCGLVLNIQGTGSVFGVQVSQSASVSGFYCNIGTQH